MSKRVNKKIAKFIILAVLAAILLSGLIFAVIWFTGYRIITYVTSDQGKIRYLGLVDRTGTPYDGKIFYGRGRTADLSSAEGELTFRNGTVIKGRIVTIKYSDGAVYNGEIAYMLREGKGIYEYVGGDVYEGDFDYDSITGTGTY